MVLKELDHGPSLEGPVHVDDLSFPGSTAAPLRWTCSLIGRTGPSLGKLRSLNGGSRPLKVKILLSSQYKELGHRQGQSKIVKE